MAKPPELILCDCGCGYERDPRRCKAHSSQTGKPCGRFPMKNQRICWKHGGAAGQNKRKAVQRKAQQTALNQMRGVLKQRGIDMDPAEHMVQSLFEAAGMVELFGAYVARLDEGSQSQANGGIRGVLKYAAPDDELDQLAVSTDEMLLTLNRHGEAQIHPFVEQFNHWHDRRFQYAERCVRAGIAERRVKLMEDQGRIVVKVIRGVLLELNPASLSNPDFPSIVRRHLALGGGDVIEGQVA